MGNAAATVFKPINRLLGIKEPKLPDTQDAQNKADALGIPKEGELLTELSDEQRRKVEEQRRRAAANRSAANRNPAGTGGNTGLISGSTGQQTTGSRLIGL